MSSLKFLSNCRYVASPFTNVQDLSWRLLIRKLGVHLCFTNVVRVLDVIQDAENTRDNLLGILATRQEDRPLIVQLFSEDPDTLVEAVNGLEGLCDAVDITNNLSDNFNDLPDDKQLEKWNWWLSCIQRVHQDCKMPIICKLPFNQQTTDETIKKGTSLQEVGCELLLLHRKSAGKINANIFKKDWDSIKVIRESVSLPIFVDVGLSTKWEIDECIEYTGVQGVAVSESLEGNPSLFCKKQPPVSDVVRQYLELCRLHSTPISNIKHHINGFCGFYLSRFHDLSTNLKDVQNLKGIEQLMEELEEVISKLSEFKKRSRDRKREEMTEVVKEKDENHVPRVVLKKLQKERVENAMKSDAQRVAIDFTLMDCMLNKDKTKSLAEAKSLRTARLPIDKYMEQKDMSPKKKKSRKQAFSIVLTVNQGNG
ncbi:tRNA-dihydrouridine(16/17) synthase [NAD(P)(+)]-like [Stylophora pistillata]|uniref:tRNA-dihydrouridine(16/17) synthase [NAD(P)(+)]-like n=1 Tax=Stylophora pistillata TaxID=50429 RepID=A0A2B4SVD5_STYPI|nr:tRNA-dihydrouridine(16/17) synthase [NAD(P)(+)]-like [Stylophora pistillata]